MSYFNDDYHYYERRRGILFYIAMMLICAVVGGFVALSAAQSMGLLVAEQPQEGSETTPEINIPPAGDVTDKTPVQGKCIRVYNNRDFFLIIEFQKPVYRLQSFFRRI